MMAMNDSSNGGDRKEYVHTKAVSQKKKLMLRVGLVCELACGATLLCSPGDRCGMDGRGSPSLKRNARERQEEGN